MAKGKPLAALMIAVVLGFSPSSLHQCLAAEQSAGSVQGGDSQAPAANETPFALTTLDSFKQSDLVRIGAWPGVGPFKGDNGEFVDANQNRLVLELDRDSIKSAQMSVSDQPKSLVKLQIAVDFLLESLGAQPGKISDFNAQLKKSRPQLTSSSSNNPLCLSAGRYAVYIHPESAHKDQVNFIVRVNGKASDATSAPAAAPPPVKTPVATATAVVAGTNTDTTADATADGATPGRGDNTNGGAQTGAGRDTSVTAAPPAVSGGDTQPTSSTRPSKRKKDDITMVTRVAPGNEPPQSDARPPATAPKTTSPTTTAMLPPPSASVTPIHPATTVSASEASLPEPDNADLRIEFSRLISNWQQIKRSALLDRDSSGLPQALSGKALSSLNELIKKLSSDHRHYELTPKSASLDHFSELVRGQKYAVYAQISENSKIIDDKNNEVMKDTTNSYGVNYTVEKVGDRWLIVDSTVVSTPPSSASKAQSDADSVKQDAANSKAEPQTAAKAPGKVSR
jgi:hypothetical protein